jgi:inositol-phosphate phosphatase/L-galactose 1-phosphate phosphatase/histidinol-phosphatase
MTHDVDLAFALDLADVARWVTMSAFGPRLDVLPKHDGTVVTALDQATERAIRSLVRATFPADGMLGEEEGLDPGTSGSSLGDRSDRRHPDVR